MRVKIWGQKWVDGSELPIVVELSAADKANIAAMAPHNSKYSQYPGDAKKYPPIAIEGWMAEENPVPKPAPKTKATPKKKAPARKRG